MANLYFRYAAMNAGKSGILLLAAHNYVERGMVPLLFTAEIDTRYGTGVITTRLGIQREANTFNASTVFDLDLIVKLAPNVACIFIDEAQFLSREQVLQLHHLVHVHGVPVICYGLRTDFLGEPFPGSTYLLALADEIEELPTICGCGGKARHNMRIDEHGKRVTEGKQIEIGGNDRYLAVCPKCWHLGVQMSRRPGKGLVATEGT